MSFAGKVVLVTGANSGIGYQTADRFAQLGATVVLSDKSSTNIDSFISEFKVVKEQQKPPLSLVGDISDDTFRQQLVDFTVDQHGQLDVLVNNAGIAPMGSIHTLTMDEYDRVINTNLRATVHLTLLVIPHLQKTKGNIVNVSSVLGQVSVASCLPYAVSKAGISHLTSCAGLELAGTGVRVNAVCPGPVNTPALQRNAKLYPGFVEKVKSIAPMNRLGEPREVTAAIVFLASDDASYITGSNLVVDGGGIAWS